MIKKFIEDMVVEKVAEMSYPKTAADWQDRSCPSTWAKYYPADIFEEVIKNSGADFVILYKLSGSARGRLLMDPEFWKAFKKQTGISRVVVGRTSSKHSRNWHFTLFWDASKGFPDWNNEDIKILHFFSEGKHVAKY